MSRPRKIVLRPEVVWFAEQMERALRRNDHKGHWLDESNQYLLEPLNDEREELECAVGNRRKPATVAREAADVGCFAMMIADNARRDEAETAEYLADLERMEIG